MAVNSSPVEGTYRTLFAGQGNIESATCDLLDRVEELVTQYKERSITTPDCYLIFGFGQQIQVRFFRFF